MTADINVPIFPESVTEGTILTWHKQPGEKITRGELLAEIETDKVVFEVPAPAPADEADIPALPCNDKARRTCVSNSLASYGLVM